MTKARIKIPETAAKGETFEVKTLVLHPMESGLRRDQDGNLVPRKILNHFTCTFNGEVVFDADLEPGIAANPYLTFFARVEEDGVFEFVWTDDDGSVITETAPITVA